MVKSKSATAGNRKHLRKIVPMLLVIGASVIQCFSPVNNCAVCQSPGPMDQFSNDDANVELTRAREQVAATQKKYETAKRLTEKGAASQSMLQRADVQRKVALLDYSSLLNPSREEKNLVLKAEVILQFRIKELTVLAELYQRGSVSKVVYLRAVAARDVAESHFKAAKSFSQAERRFQEIKAAKSKYEVAQSEFEIANRLFQSQAISQSRLDRASSNLKIARAELEFRKQSLGARATQVRQ